MSSVLYVSLPDRRDPSVPDGRSYRQVNYARTHAIPIGTLVELENGARLFVILHTRDCDGTPLYSLSADAPEDEDPTLGHYRRHHGHPEDGLTVIRLPGREVGGGGAP